jgi:hypothetical protein
MKKSLIISALLAGASATFGQGTVNFGDHVVGSFIIHIYGPQVATPTLEIQGNAATDTPAGSTVYTGGLVGGSATGTGLGNGNDITVELYAAPGNVVAGGLAGLSPVSQYITTASTKSAAAGTFVAVSPSSDPGIPDTAAGGATVALVAWYNGGTGVSLANSVYHGNSDLVYLSTLGGYIVGGAPGQPPPLGVTSFSLVTTPEPSTIALGVIGAASFLIRRRK